MIKPPAQPELDDKHYECVLEAICQQGCSIVDITIDALQQGHIPEAAQQLNPAEIERLLGELLAIMQPLRHD